MTDVAPAAPPREEAPPRIKLRSACDRCSHNKIKCSQDKPECQRCKAIGVQCHYSRSMRMGKPRKSAKAKTMANNNSNNSTNNSNSCDANEKIETNTTLCQQSDMHLASSHHHHHHHHWPADWSTGDFLQPPLFDSSPEVPPTAYSQQSNDSFLAISSSQSQSPPSSGHDAIIKDDPENVYLSPSSYYAPSFDITLLPSTTTTSTTATSAGPYTPPEGLSPSMLFPQPKPHDCTQLALETLVSLSLPSTVQKTSHGQPRPTMEQVLKANSEAMKHVSTMLSCSCPKDSSFPMLLATIFSKTLAWYQAAIDFNDDSLCDSTTASNPTVFNHVAEEIVHRPISVGGYELDDESCDLMKVQLVLSRLRMMTKPVKQYLDTYALSGSYPSPPSDKQRSVSTVSSTQVFLTMGIFVQSRLQRTIDGLQSKLSQ